MSDNAPLQMPPYPLPEIPLIQWQPDLWRIGLQSVLTVKRYPTARHRFDPPNGEYSVLYASADCLGPFGEVFIRRARRISDPDGDRYLLSLKVNEPLNVIDLCDNAILETLGCSSAIATGLNYETCQAWAMALYIANPDADAIRYPARLGGEDSTNVALLTDRCLGKLSIAKAERLSAIEPIVQRAADRYGLYVNIAFDPA